MTDISSDSDSVVNTKIVPLQSTVTSSLVPTTGYASLAIGPRLSVMMFLQYAVWGIWLPYIANYLGASISEGGLGFTGAQIGWILGLAGASGALCAPFIGGQIADRYLNAERALAILLLVGGAINIALAYTTDYYTFLFLSIAYSVVYMPTLSLTNSIAFQNLPDPEKQFPPIRLWGTIGWIVASVAFTTLWLSYSGHLDWLQKYRVLTVSSADTVVSVDTAMAQALSMDKIVNTQRVAHALVLSGLISFAYAIYALAALPKTPPKQNVAHPLAFAEAFGLFRNRAFLVVTLVALPIAMIHQCYFFRAGPFFENAVGVAKSNIGPVMAIGQASEIFFLLILGYFIKRLGYKWVLILGCCAYTIRFGIFALGTPATLVIASQALHGLSYGCFFAGSFLLVEKLAGEDFRHSAQTVFGMIILGLGPILAGFYNQEILERVSSGGIQYGPLWSVQALVALGALLILLVGFPQRIADYQSSQS
jgi:nucleoside transporter